MKKILVLSVALVALVVSCQKEQNGQTSLGEQQVTLSVNVPVVATKVAGDGKLVDKLYYELFDSENSGLVLTNKLASGTAEIDGNGICTLQFNLAKNSEYTVLYWAQKDGIYEPFADTEKGLQNINMNYSTKSDAPAAGNDENRDAFYGVQTFVADGTDPASKDLTRPFAQLNFVSTDYFTPIGFGNSPIGEFVLDATTIDVEEAGTSFNVYTGKSNQTQGSHVYFATYATATSPAYVDLDGVSGIDHFDDEADMAYVSMNYVLLVDKNADDAKVNANFYYSIYNDNGTPETDDDTTISYDDPQSYTLENVKLYENYRTIVSGDFFSGNANAIVKVNADFSQPDIE